MSEKTRYSDKELEEFRAIINEKLEVARQEYENYRAAVTNADGNDTVDTSPTYKVLEEGASTLSKEEAGRLAQRQMKFIQNLQAALIRIENKTYGVCRETGKLVPKERLRAVPHEHHHQKRTNRRFSHLLGSTRRPSEQNLGENSYGPLRHDSYNRLV